LTKIHDLAIMTSCSILKSSDMNENWHATQCCSNRQDVLLPSGCGRTMELTVHDLFLLEFNVMEADRRTGSVVMPCAQCACGAISLVEDVPETIQNNLPGIVKWYALQAS
jgi:hypothetical protein